MAGLGTMNTWPVFVIENFRHTRSISQGASKAEMHHSLLCRMTTVVTELLDKLDEEIIG
jgi:hypothetical protein